MYRWRGTSLEVLLAHPGGPYFVRKDEGAWTLPKGQVEPGEEPLAAACREFNEETGFLPRPPFMDLGEVRQKSGKRVRAWAFEGDADTTLLVCNLFEIEWPPRSGQRRSFPEIDRAEWFAPEQARRRIMVAQAPFLDRLAALLAPSVETPRSPGCSTACGE
jgi:predicted NUDIX family NTP pyrophosphohydrolase